MIFHIESFDLYNLTGGPKMATKQVKRPTVRKTITKKTSAKTSIKKVEVSLKTKAEDVVDAVENTIEDVQERTESVFALTKGAAKQIWFANLGIYGSAFEAVQTRYTKLIEARKGLVSELVSRGEKVQDDAEGMIKEGRSNVEQQVEKVTIRLAEVSPLLDVNANMKKLSQRLESVRKTLKKVA